MSTLLIALFVYVALVLLVMWAALRARPSLPWNPDHHPADVAHRIRSANPQILEALDAPAKRKDAVAAADPHRRVGRAVPAVAVAVGDGLLSECRTDWVTRHLVDIVASAVRRGDLTTSTAAQKLREHMVPQHVALRVLGGMQCK